MAEAIEAEKEAEAKRKAQVVRVVRRQARWSAASFLISVVLTIVSVIWAILYNRHHTSTTTCLIYKEWFARVVILFWAMTPPTWFFFEWGSGFAKSFRRRNASALHIPTISRAIFG
jgi:hypothetical protein